MAKSESEAVILFRKQLESAVSGESLIYVISEPEQLALLPKDAVRVPVSVDIDTTKERFKIRMHGNLPAPVAQMPKKKHGGFDSGSYDYRFDSVRGDIAAFCESLKEKEDKR